MSFLVKMKKRLGGSGSTTSSFSCAGDGATGTCKTKKNPQTTDFIFH
jgi:hypothetical protein